MTNEGVGGCSWGCFSFLSGGVGGFEHFGGDPDGLTDGRAEEPGGQSFKALALVGDVAGESAGECGEGVSPHCIEVLANHQCGMAGGVDEGDGVAEGFLDGGSEEGVVGAAEDEGGDVEIHEGLEVFAEDESDEEVIGESAFFDHGYEEGAGAGEDLDGGVECGDGGGVGGGGDGGFGGDEADAFGGILFMGDDIDGGVGAGFEDADDGDVKVVLEFIESECGGGVAGDDEEFGFGAGKEA